MAIIRIPIRLVGTSREAVLMKKLSYLSTFPRERFHVTFNEPRFFEYCQGNEFWEIRGERDDTCHTHF